MTHEKDWNEKYQISLRFFDNPKNLSLLLNAKSDGKISSKQHRQYRLVASGWNAVNNADEVKSNWINIQKREILVLKSSGNSATEEFMISLKASYVNWQLFTQLCRGNYEFLLSFFLLFCLPFGWIVRLISSFSVIWSDNFLLWSDAFERVSDEW